MSAEDCHLNSAAAKKILEKAVAALAQETSLQFEIQIHLNTKGIEDGSTFN